MLDLVRKIQGYSPVAVILPQAQFELAMAISGRGQLTAKQIAEHLDFTSTKIHGLLNIMSSRGIVKNSKNSDTGYKPYQFSLCNNNFKLKGAA